MVPRSPNTNPTRHKTKEFQMKRDIIGWLRKEKRGDNAQIDIDIDTVRVHKQIYHQNATRERRKRKKHP